MPELPEVEAARRALHESCCSRRVVQASVAEDPIVIDGVSSSALETALTGRTILAAFRKGKNIWLQLDAPPWPSFQFGMTGAFYIKGKEITKYKRSAVSDKEEWPSKFSKVFLKLDDGLEVSFTDKRRLARVRLLDDPAAAPPISELGPDALLELPTEAMLASRILKKKCPIKALLLDQSFVAGIGNWVADEVLYQARIHPEQVASSLSEADCAKLRKTIEEVVRFAVEVDADSERFPKNWIFHYRWNKKPGEVDGHKVAFIIVGGRTSAIVPALQKCTAHSSQKQKRVAEEQVDEKGKLKNGTRDGKKNGRKTQASKKAVSEEAGEDSDAEPGTSDGKKKGSKSWPAKRAVSEEATEEGSDDPDGEPVKRKSRGSRSLAKKAGPRLRGKGARPPQGVQGTGIESNSALKDQKPDRSSQTRRTAKSPAAVTTALDVAAKLGTKRGRATTKQQEAVEVQTDDTDKHTMVATNQKDKVSNTGHSQRGIKSSRNSLEREKPIVDEVVKGSTISKKVRGQKRRRVAK